MAYSRDIRQKCDWVQCDKDARHEVYDATHKPRGIFCRKHCRATLHWLKSGEDAVTGEIARKAGLEV